MVDCMQQQVVHYLKQIDLCDSMLAHEVVQCGDLAGMSAGVLEVVSMHALLLQCCFLHGL